MHDTLAKLEACLTQLRTLTFCRALDAKTITTNTWYASGLSHATLLNEDLAGPTQVNGTEIAHRNTLPQIHNCRQYFIYGRHVLKSRVGNPKTHGAHLVQRFPVTQLLPYPGLSPKRVCAGEVCPSSCRCDIQTRRLLMHMAFSRRLS